MSTSMQDVILTSIQGTLSTSMQESSIMWVGTMLLTPEFFFTKLSCLSALVLFDQRNLQFVPNMSLMSLICQPDIRGHGAPHHHHHDQRTELRSCVKVEVAVKGSPSLITLIVSVDVKQHWTSELRSCVKVEVDVLGSRP